MTPGGLLFLVTAAFVTHKVITVVRVRGKGRSRRLKKGSLIWRVLKWILLDGPRWIFGKRKKKAKKSFYWGNNDWTEIRDKRTAENNSRYGLKPGTCHCERCGTNIRGKEIHCDHIYPRKHFPHLQLAYWNTQILCSKCNLSKSDKKGHNWRRLRQWRLHPVVWYLRDKQVRTGERK